MGGNIKSKPPEIRKLTLNVDAAITIGCGFIGVGGVVRNSDKWVVAAVARRTTCFFDPFIAECVGLHDCLYFCFESNVCPDYIKTDSTRVIEAIRERSSTSLEGSIVSDVIHLFALLGNVGASFIPCVREI
ncbi:Ribonuclease H-like domain containing protein [Parasponia andersonii]|uniref:Ribonuclease H-like domain containing protein n=1 Tax=Parasponia andersonii TaxID=3476 RepID=A0A2P5E0L6_PARAD|nr:Ribonuclease H-like domain containing protein [Parasponia andersonii]